MGAERVAAGQDRSGEHHGLGVSVLDFKLSTRETDGVWILRVQPIEALTRQV